jgi:hypothetical protein
VGKGDCGWALTRRANEVLTSSRIPFFPQHRPEHTYDESVQSAQILLGPIGRPTRAEQPRLLKNGAAAHELTREDRAKGGRTRAEKIRRRKELRERFEVAQLEDLAGAELELLDQALVRLNLLIGSEDDRVALRAVIEVLDRTLGRPRQQQACDRSFEGAPDMEAALAEAREKLAMRLKKRHAAPP